MLSTNRPQPGKRFAAVRMPPVEKRGSRMTKKRWALLAIAILIVGTGAVWASGYFDRDPRLVEIGEMWTKIKDVPEKDRFAKMGEIFKKVSDLPPDLQQKLRDEAMKRGPPPGMGGPDVGKLLALPIDKRNAEIDKQLDAMLERQKQFEQMQKSAGQQGAGAPGPSMFGGGGGQPNAFRNRMLSSIPASSKAAWTQWGQLMKARANERGITMPNWGR
jgi:hypothetical protein